MRKATKVLIGFMTMMMAVAVISGGIFGNGRALAAGTGDFSGEGTSGNPYLVGTPEQLNKIRENYLNANLYFKLTRNIDLSGYDEAGWVPIGNETAPFNGNIDGNGYQITGLSINTPESDNIGLFGYISTGSSMKGMKLVDVAINGRFAVGGLVGYNEGGAIADSSASGSVSGSSAVGGLVGNSSGGVISNSKAAVTVSGSMGVGGLVGNASWSEGVISNSSAAGNVSGGRNSEGLGGLVGMADGITIGDSHAKGSVTGDRGSKMIGGLVGVTYSVAINESYASGDVSGSTNVGGLVGNISIGNEINESYALGKVSGKYALGGLVGRNNNGTLINSYAQGDVVASSDGSLAGGLVGDHMFGRISGSYTTGNVSGGAASFYVGGLVAYNMSGTISESYASGTVSVGDGSASIGGLVGYDNTGTIETTFATGNVSAGDGSQEVGGLVGTEYFGTIRKSYAAGDVTESGDSFHAGGLVGNNNGEIDNSYASGKVSGKYYIGGLVGFNNNDGFSIRNSYASGKTSGVEGSENVGGLVGYNSSGSTFNSYYDLEATGQAVSAGGTGLTNEQMKQAGTYEQVAANPWVLTNVWAIDSVRNDGYPYLRAAQAYVDYDGNGNESGTVPASRSFIKGSQAKVYSGGVDLVKTGHILYGWNTKADGSGTMFKAGDSFPIASHTVLYAIWMIPSTDATLTSAIGHVSNGGSADERITDIPYGTTVDDLKAAITPAAEATFDIYDEDGVTLATALTTGKKIIVTAQDGITQVTYTLAVAANGANAITAFSLAGQIAPAAIDAEAHTIAIQVKSGTDRNGLVAAFALSEDATAKVGNVDQVSGMTANDFTNPITYTVRAANGIAQDWTVTVTVFISSEKDILSFSMVEQAEEAAIDTDAHTVLVQVKSGTNRNGLVAAFALSDGATAMVGSVTQVSGTTANNFTNPVTYAVKAEDGSTQNWKVTVVFAPSSEKEITAFSLAAQTKPAIIDAVAHTVTVQVAPGTNLTNMTAVFSLSSGAYAKVGSKTQTSGVTVNNFTNPVTYLVRAADNSSQNWTVTVWTQNDYSVSFDSNEGTAVEGQSVAHNGKALAPADPAKEGYVFAGWHTDNLTFANPFDFDNTEITANTMLYAKWTEITGLQVAITSANGTVSGVKPSYAYGEQAALTAVSLPGYKFEGWMDTTTGKTLSTKEAYIFTVTANVSLTANFGEIIPDRFTVTFLSESGQILSVQQVVKGGSATPPPSPSKPDSVFLNWSADYTNVQSDLTLKPVYSVKVKTYTLTVVGGSVQDGAEPYYFDTKVTVTADTPPAGQQFSYWTMQGNIVSYSATYSLYITGDTTITAVFSAVPAAREPIVAISPDPIADPVAKKISFIGQIDLPAGFSLVECGLVVKQSAVPVTDLNFSTAGAIRAKSSSQTATGQYMMNKTGVNHGDTWYARAYLIYKDSGGKVVTIYSAIVSSTMP